jgi:hypothetical protein
VEEEEDDDDDDQDDPNYVPSSHTSRVGTSTVSSGGGAYYASTGTGSSYTSGSPLGSLTHNFANTQLEEPNDNQSYGVGVEGMSMAERAIAIPNSGRSTENMGGLYANTETPAAQQYSYSMSPTAGRPSMSSCKKLWTLYVSRSVTDYLAPRYPGSNTTEAYDPTRYPEDIPTTREYI